MSDVTISNSACMIDTVIESCCDDTKKLWVTLYVTFMQAHSQDTATNLPWFFLAFILLTVRSNHRHCKVYDSAQQQLILVASSDQEWPPKVKKPSSGREFFALLWSLLLLPVLYIHACALSAQAFSVSLCYTLIWLGLTRRTIEPEILHSKGSFEDFFHATS